MAGNMKELDKNNFDKETVEGKWAVDFWASWCGPCRLMGPHFEAASKEMKDVNFAKVDAQANPELAQKNEIRGIPCIVFFSDGQEVGRSVGLVEKDEIISRANAAFG